MLLNQKTHCLCCNGKTIPQKDIGWYTVCPVCFWVRDNDATDPEAHSKPNGMKLGQGRSNFAKFGACDKKFVEPKPWRDPFWSRFRYKESLLHKLKPRWRCLCCNSKAHLKSSDEWWEICPVCFWTRDWIINPDEPSEVNGMTLAEGRANYLVFGACKEDFADLARKPRWYER